MSIESTLKERGNIYGDYRQGLSDRAAIMQILRTRFAEVHGIEMPGILQGALWDIVNKLCRLAVTPEHIDSWHDIQGYAKLTEAMLTTLGEPVHD